MAQRNNVDTGKYRCTFKQVSILETGKYTIIHNISTLI